MDTDFSGKGASSWRKQESPRGSTPPTTSDDFAAANFDHLWRNPKDDEGKVDLQAAVRLAMNRDAPRTVASDKFKAECVAWRYLATLAGSSAAFGTPKQANTTGLAKEIAGPKTGATLINVYMGGTVQGDSAEKTSVGIGDDWLPPHITRDGKVLQVGLPPDDKDDPDPRPKFTLPY